LGIRRRGAGEVRELCNSVFDILEYGRGHNWLGLGLGLFNGPPAVVRVGRGSYVNEVIGKWAPTGLVDWMVGVRRR